MYIKGFTMVWKEHDFEVNLQDDHLSHMLNDYSSGKFIMISL